MDVWRCEHCKLLNREGTLNPDGTRIPQYKFKITPCEHILAKKPAFTQSMDVVYVPLGRSVVGMDAWIRGVGGLQVSRKA